MNAKINLTSDVLIAILMNDSFEFDADTHSTLADVTANQLPTYNGYVQDSHTFTTPTLVEDDANNKGTFTCDDLTIAAKEIDDNTGIGPIGSYIIVDTTTTDNTVIANINFTTDITIINTTRLKLRNIALNLI